MKGEENIERPPIDKECVSLVDALNAIKGIKVIQCSFYKGKQAMCVWFELDKKYFENLHIIGRIICNRYGGYNNWYCNPYSNDICKFGKLDFELCSGFIIGEEARRQADEMANNIYYHLNHVNYKKGFNIITEGHPIVREDKINDILG